MRKPSRSFFRPSSNGSSIAARTASAAANGASSPRAFLVSAATALVKIEISALAAASLESSSRSLRSGRFSATSLRAKASPPETGSFDDLLDQAALERFGRADRIAADDHLDGELGADRARQALRAAGAGQQAELHLGQAEPRFLDRRRDSGRPARPRGRRRARCRGWRQRSASANSPSATSTSCRPGGFGGLPNSVMSAPAMKVRPPQVSTIALTLGVGDRALHAFEDAAAHRGAQRIDRRAVDRDDADVVMTFEL